MSPAQQTSTSRASTISAWGGGTEEREFFHAADADLRERAPWYIILPSDGWKQVWDMVIVLFVLYSAIVIPLNVGFGDPDCNSNCNPVSRRQFFDLTEYNLDILDLITGACVRCGCWAPTQAILTTRFLSCARRRVCSGHRSVVFHRVHLLQRPRRVQLAPHCVSVLLAVLCGGFVLRIPL